LMVVVERALDVFGTIRPHPGDGGEDGQVIYLPADIHGHFGPSGVDERAFTFPSFHATDNCEYDECCRKRGAVGGYRLT